LTISTFWQISIGAECPNDFIEWTIREDAVRGQGPINPYWENGEPITCGVREQETDNDATLPGL
jgi:hypothetical protein